MSRVIAHIGHPAVGQFSFLSSFLGGGALRGNARYFRLIGKLLIDFVAYWWYYNFFASYYSWSAM